MSGAWRVLDLFCGAGGAAMGLHRAWPDAEITGVDVVAQPRYPFRFVQADAMTFPLDGFDFVWASPPCQHYTTMSNRWRGMGGRVDEHPSLIAATRERLLEAGCWYVLENVVGALQHLRFPVLLHGGMFDLSVHRPRLFETNPAVLMIQAQPVKNPIGVYGKHPDGRLLWRRRDGSGQRCAASTSEAGVAMGIDWMTEWRELAEAIPPAYSEYLARQIRPAAEARGTARTVGVAG